MWITHSRQNLQEVRVILRSIDQSAPLDQHLTIKSLLIGQHLRDMHTIEPFWNRTFETFLSKGVIRDLCFTSWFQPVIVLVYFNQYSSPLHIWVHVFCIHNRFIFIHIRNIWYICFGIHRYIVHLFLVFQFLVFLINTSFTL